MTRLTILFVAVFALGGASVAAASDTYLPSNQPLIKGTVTEVGEHSITVDSFGGERLTFEVDSRTVMPTTLQPGTRAKIEFHTMEDGRSHAARVTPFEPTPDELAMMRPVTLDERHDAGDDVRVMNASANDRRGDDAEGDDDDRAAVSADRDGDETREARAAGEDDELPRTAGQSHLFGFLALLAMGAASAMAFQRRHRGL